LNLLIERFNYPTPKSATEEELDYFRQNIRRPVQLRVTNVVKNWVDKHYLDFQGSKELLKRFLEFVKDDMANAVEMEKVVASLTKAIRKKREDETDQSNRKSFVLGPNENIPDPIRTGVSAGFMDLMDVSVFLKIIIKYINKKLLSDGISMVLSFSCTVGSLGNCQTVDTNRG
jgi:hypothetical protein